MTTTEMWFGCVLTTLGILNAAQAASFRLYNGSLDNYIDTPVDNLVSIYPYLNKTLNITIYAAGFKNSANGTAVVTMMSTYMSILNTNVILLNWEKESQGLLPYIFGYGPAVVLAKAISITAGDSIVKLIDNGVDPNSIRLVGHSLGAHMMGWVAERIQKYNYNVSNICGLDPAGPAFGTPIGLNGLNPSRAPLVYVVHTNAGEYGIDEPCGTVDFWVNCNDGGLQPGCPKGLYPPLNENSTCSHNRSWMLLAEALRILGSFPAESADSCSDWEAQNISNVVINYFGDNVDASKKGNFYFSTNDEYPYSKGQDGIKPN